MLPRFDSIYTLTVQTMPETMDRKRPYIPRDMAKRVEQFASKQGVPDGQAYADVITCVLDEEGNIREEIANAIQR